MIEPGEMAAWGDDHDNWRLLFGMWRRLRVKDGIMADNGLRSGVMTRVSFCILVVRAHVGTYGCRNASRFFFAKNRIAEFSFRMNKL